MADEKLYATWSDFGRAITDLTKIINQSDFEPNCVVAIARGGLVVGGALAHALGIKNVLTINVEYYQGNGVDDTQLPEPVVLAPGLDPELVRGLRVLIADDVADSGVTLSFMQELLGESAAEIRNAVWFHKPRSSVVPDFASLSTDKWIVFPWSPHSPFADAD